MGFVRFLNILFIWFLGTCLNAQELPPVENHTPFEYGAGNQNWGISQTQNKHIYLANNRGLLEFDGVQWKLHLSPNGSEIRSVKAVGSKVYTGCYMEFGYWERNPHGDLTYRSLSQQIKAPLVEDEQFWNIMAVDDWVLFQSLNRIYIYDTKDGFLEMVEAESKRAQMFDLESGIYFQKEGQGVFKIEEGKPVLVTDDVVVRENVVVGLFEVGKRLVFLTEGAKFYFLERDKLQRWQIGADKELTDVNVYSSLQLRDGSIAIGSISNGVYLLDTAGNIALAMNQEQGLNNNTVLSLFEDIDHNLWLGLNIGLSIINLRSPFNEYNDNFGELGVVSTSIVHEGFLYLGTNQGLFHKPINGSGDFTFIENTTGQVWCLRKIDDILFCGHNNGTFVVEADKATLVSSFPGTWEIKPIAANRDLLLQGNFKGLSVLQRKNGRWSFRNKVKGFNISSRFFEFIGEHSIMVNHELKGVFILDLDDGFTEVIGETNQHSMGYGASLVNYNGDVIYTNSSGVFTFDVDKREFTLDTLLHRKLFLEGERPVGILVPDTDGKGIWGFGEKSIMHVAPGKFGNEPHIERIPTPSFFRRSLGVLGFESITPLDDGHYLVGISNGFVTLDLEKIKPRKHQLKITSITKEFHDATPQKVSLETDAEYAYAENNLHFSYSVPEYDKYEEVLYQYRLQGIYDEWSKWSSDSGVSFKNLPFGEYAFQVRAMVGNTMTENTASYSFAINRPWYWSVTAIIGYCLALGFIIYVTHRQYRGYYRRQQEHLLRENRKKLKRKKLKAEKKIVQIRNEKLKQEIDSKNRELAVSTMSLIKRNEFLNRIKKELVGAKDTKDINSVIRIIDRNINSEDDWRYFEEAFNNVDKDFLKKVKRLHPDLTSHDLRLCAYLRLNLTSKEIAPLMNISVRSVEVKRYRLRKKMDLAHETSLTDHILSI
ncbi:MAG: triple tyrosine motif-containing protein [Flavobacteriaceae bacterium]